jgi:hypothetical protein
MSHALDDASQRLGLVASQRCQKPMAPSERLRGVRAASAGGFRDADAFDYGLNATMAKPSCWTMNGKPLVAEMPKRVRISTGYIRGAAAAVVGGQAILFSCAIVVAVVTVRVRHCRRADNADRTVYLEYSQRP